MFRLTVLAMVVSLMFGFSTHGNNFAEGYVSSKSPEKLDGVYEFVSESVALVEPKNAASQRTSPEWSGIWQFQNGYFTRILMKRRRDAFFDPKKRDDFGFESSAGRYEIEGRNVRLVRDQAFHKFCERGLPALAGRGISHRAERSVARSPIEIPR
jgi:hypothetical protein